MTKGRLSQYLKEIRDKKLENQMFGQLWTCDEWHKLYSALMS